MFKPNTNLRFSALFRPLAVNGSLIELTPAVVCFKNKDNRSVDWNTTRLTDHGTESLMTIGSQLNSFLKGLLYSVSLRT